jgi:hypothetical protein
MNSQDEKKRRLSSAQNIGTAEGNGMGKHDPTLTGM